jgi:hypothetical protein
VGTEDEAMLSGKLEEPDIALGESDAVPLSHILKRRWSCQIHPPQRE